jgi:hypothetical protein
VNDDDSGDRRTLLERHVQTIIVSATIALLGWVLLTTLDIRDKLSRFEERLLNLQTQVNAGTDDRFRASEWRREKEVIEERFNRIERLIDQTYPPKR